MRISIASLAAAALLWIPSAAAAQIGIGVAGGPVVPLGDLGERVEGGVLPLPLLPAT